MDIAVLAYIYGIDFLLSRHLIINVSSSIIGRIANIVMRISLLFCRKVATMLMCCCSLWGCIDKVPVEMPSNLYVVSIQADGRVVQDASFLQAVTSRPTFVILFSEDIDESLLTDNFLIHRKSDKMEIPIQTMLLLEKRVVINTTNLISPATYVLIISDKLRSTEATGRKKPLGIFNMEFIVLG